MLHYASKLCLYYLLHNLHCLIEIQIRLSCSTTLTHVTDISLYHLVQASRTDAFRLMKHVSAFSTLRICSCCAREFAVVDYRREQCPLPNVGGRVEVLGC